MRRALLSLSLCLPSLALAQVAGTVVNGTTGGDDQYVNIEECAGVGPAGPVTLNWNVRMQGGGTPGNGVFRIYATNVAPTSSNGIDFLCETQDVTTAVPPVHAQQVGVDVDATVGQPTGNADVATAELAAAATPSTFACDPAVDEPIERTIHVCVHFVPDGSATPTGSAKGTLTLSLKRPSGPPSSLTITPGDLALNLSWEAVADADGGYRYQLVQLGTDGLPVPGFTPIGGDLLAGTTSVRVSGLLQGTDYEVSVWSLSASLNESADAVTGTGSPTEVDDFWDYYSGAEQGGCAGGPAGPLALLGLAGLLAVLRRRP